MRIVNAIFLLDVSHVAYLTYLYLIQAMGVNVFAIAVCLMDINVFAIEICLVPCSIYI